MSAHTPGPWKAGRNSAYWEVCTERHRLEKGIPYSVADVCASDPNNPDGGLQEANARLIAAAPDLLEALIHMVSVAERDGWQTATTGRQLFLWDAKVAIAKAKGETP
jgi:hypothetical protein